MVRQPLYTNRSLETSDFPISVMSEYHQEEVKIHGHSFVELVLVQQGNGRHLAGEDDFPISRGDVFVLAGDQIHGYQDTHNLVITNILFDPIRLAFPLHDAGTIPGYHALFTLEPQYRQRHRFESRLRLTPRQLSRVVALARNLAEELERQMPGYQFTAVALLMQIISAVSRYYTRMETQATESILRIAEAMSFLESNRSQPIGLDELCNVAHMSKSSLRRAFLQAVGCSPIEYLIRLRVEHACALLRETDRSVTEIALQVGFSDSNYLARQFRRHMGCTPREYRRR